MMPDEMQDKNSHSLYLTNECMAKADELAGAWGIPKSAVFEYAIRAVYDARSALTYEIARQQAEADIRREERDEP